ncbi:MAG TPA: HdeD family acid-resistance protein [Verrucomicrobiae bacterium]|nr:HdeD family acid-resistance protein [Verrucomicrobiae bacterium]
MIPTLNPENSPIRLKWGWSVAVGVVFVILAALAFGHLTAATLASVIFIGSLMTIGGVIHIIHAFQMTTWKGFIYWAFAGMLYGVAGVVALTNPVFAAATLTLIFAWLLIISGLLRIGLGIHLRRHSGWGWIVASGVITGLAGLIFATGWPSNTLWLLGMIIAIDLVFQGSSLIGFGFALKPTSHSGSR